MSQQALVDKVLEAAKAKVGGEVGGLLGTKLDLSDAANRYSSKGDFFQIKEKIVLSRLQVEGEQEGEIFLVVSVKDAILLGGTLIMLPAAELESHISSEEFSDDESDAFGEIANIIAGVYSATFEELYPKKNRFVKTSIEVIDPGNVEADSADPFPDQPLYISSSTMNMDGKELGQMHLLFPAELLELSSGTSAAADKSQEEATESAGDAANEDGEKQIIPEATQPQSSKHSQSLIDKVLEAARAKISGEVGGLLGTQLKTADAVNKNVSKAEFFKSSEKIVLAKMRVEGEREGETYLAISLKDATLFGGALIMLPEAELDKHINNEEFNADISDAFGEIANIIAGIYSSTFEELFPEKIRFVRDDFEIIEPAKVEMESATPFPDQEYYMSSYGVDMDGKQLDEVRVLFPVDLLGMESAFAETSAATTSTASSGIKSVGSGEEKVLIIAQKQEDGQFFAETIEGCGYKIQILSFGDNVKESAAGNCVLAVFLIMNEVDDQGVATIIKAKSVCGNASPLIAAGPQWTRKTVLQAVKYGACDILVTPAVPEEIKQKVQMHLNGAQPQLQANG